MASARTCSVCCRAVAQLVADHAGEVATERTLGHQQRCAVFGNGSHSVGDGHSLIEPCEVRVCPPGFTTDQQGVRHVDAD